MWPPDHPKGRQYTEIHHNDHPFVLLLLPEEPKVCKGCGNDFCHRQRIVPHDLVLQHKERRYFFPINRDWKNKQALNKEATRYYHADPACLILRLPYFSIEFIEIQPEVKDLLNDSQKLYFKNFFRCWSDCRDRERESFNPGRSFENLMRYCSCAIAAPQSFDLVTKCQIWAKISFSWRRNLSQTIKRIHCNSTIGRYWEVLIGQHR